jgi:sentrin-specific protease 1
MVDFSYDAYKHLRMGIAYLLKQAVDVIYRDNQLTTALDELCSFDVSDENMIKVDVAMINQALTRPRGSDDHVIRYDEIVHDESDHFLHILKDENGYTVACSKSDDDSQFSTAEQELSLDPETVYKDAAEGGWPDMKNDLKKFLRYMKNDRSKPKKKRVRKKTSGTNSNSNVTENNQTANSARPSTPADATSRPAAAATPSTKTPDPKKKRGSNDPHIMPTVSTDEFAPTTQGIRNSLYDKDGNLRPEVISMLHNDENYALIKCRLSRSDRVSAIVNVIAPEFEGNAKEWVNDIDLPSVDSSTVTRDANNLETLLNALTRGQSKRAADAIIRMLNRPECSDIKDAVKNALNVLLNENVQLSIQVVDGIKEAIAHHTNSKGGTRTIDAETFVKNTVLACVWGTVRDGEDVAISRLSEIIGTTDNQVKMASTTARGLIDGDTAIAALERKRRKDFIRDTLLPHLYRWIIDDDVTRFDSNQSHATIVDPEDPSKKIKVHQRIWRLTNREQQHKEFLQSSYYKAFMEMNPSATGVGITVFSEGLKKFKKLVSNPKPESCVDEKVSGLEYAMEAMFGVLNKGETKEAFMCHQCKEGEIAPDEVLELMRLRSSHKLVDAVCCEKVERPDLHIDKEKDCPRMIPFSCTHGKFVEEEGKKKGKGKGKGSTKKKKKKKGNTERCQCCGYKKRLMALFDKVKDDERLGNKVVTVMVWEKARRQGKAKSGKDNTQQELTSKVMTVAQLIDHFVKLLHICIPHIQEIRWIKHLQDTDFTKMSPGTILIFTDYAALMALRARQAKNSSVDAHAICDNFVILWNKRVVKVTGKKKDESGVEVDIEEEVTISNVDIVHFFAETFEKGKKNDHAMHNTCLDYIICKYRAKLRELGIELIRVLLWTDNAPNQYRCRQTFIQVASVELRHPGIKVIHRLAVVDNFKGIHDAVGKDPSRTVKELENIGIRSPNAFMVFVNCIQHLETFETKWDVYEKKQDIRLKDKGRFGMSERVMLFVVETKEDFNRLAPQYPGRILLCDRSSIQDTINEKCIIGTTQLHEVRTIETSIPRVEGSQSDEDDDEVDDNEEEDNVDDNDEEVMNQIRHWRALCSDLPCNCEPCNIFEEEVEAGRVNILDSEADVANIQCQYHPWRNTRIEIMKGYVHLEPTTPSSQSREEYLASQETIEAMDDDQNQSTESTPANQSTESDCESNPNARIFIDGSSIEALAMLQPERRAIVTRLLQVKSSPDYNLSYASNSAYAVQHESLKRLGPRRWLNDELINGFNIHYLGPKLDERSHIFSSHFMSKLLSTGDHGTNPPNYKYANVETWSNRIAGGLFNQHNIFVPINHQNIHWLTLRINFLEKRISLWDSQGVKHTNVLYTHTALRYLGDEHENAFPEGDTTKWLKSWRIEDLSDKCPQQENDFDCGIFHLLNLCLLVNEGGISLESYSQASINTKEVRKIVAYLLWAASSNCPVVKTRYE